MTTPLHDSSEKKPGPAKPSSDTARSVAALRDVVVNLCEIYLADGMPSPQERARLRALLAVVEQRGYPNKWSRAIALDSALELPFDEEDPGHG